MRRFVTAFILVAIVPGVVAAQESAFRFEAETTQENEGVVVAEDTQEPAEPESYQTWPSADGRSAVQKKAMFRSEQRQLRIASRQWYGFSQSRPTVVAMPYMTHYHPLWVGRHWHPYYSWYGTMWR